MNNTDMLAGLLAQAQEKGGDIVTLRAIVEEASELGAHRTLTLMGLDDETARHDLSELRQLLQAWRDAKASGDVNRVQSFYTPDFALNGKTLEESQPLLKVELGRLRGKAVEMKDLSVLRWTDGAETMVVTFGEVPVGARTGVTKRQYWVRQGPQWKIFFEGVVG